VDDAIVVMENIYVKVEQGMNPVEAGLKGSKEIYFAIISTTITLISVFFPIVFLQGITGRLFREFSIVMAGAVAISAFLALSLTPMVSTKLLRREGTHSWFFRKTEKFFNRLNLGEKAVSPNIEVIVLVIDRSRNSTHCMVLLKNNTRLIALILGTRSGDWSDFAL